MSALRVLIKVIADAIGEFKWTAGVARLGERFLVHEGGLRGSGPDASLNNVAWMERTPALSTGPTSRQMASSAPPAANHAENGLVTSPPAHFALAEIGECRGRRTGADSIERHLRKIAGIREYLTRKRSRAELFAPTRV